MKRKIKIGDSVIAKVSIMGAKRGTGWRYAEYQRIKSKSGFKFIRYLTYGMYPNKANFKFSKEFEEEALKDNIPVFYGRPNIQDIENNG